MTEANQQPNIPNDEGDEGNSSEQSNSADYSRDNHADRQNPIANQDLEQRRLPPAPARIPWYFWLQTIIAALFIGQMATSLPLIPETLGNPIPRQRLQSWNPKQDGTAIVGSLELLFVVGSATLVSLTVAGLLGQWRATGSITRAAHQVMRGQYWLIPVLVLIAVARLLTHTKGLSDYWLDVCATTVSVISPIVWGVGVGCLLANLIEPAARLWSRRFAIGSLLVAGFLYAAIFVWMGSQEYRARLVPHGDAIMYEEHLANLLAGKGFRSQLDNGRLFLGERFQILHGALIPFYYFVPSFETLLVGQALALAGGSAVVYLLARTLGISRQVSILLGIAYLCYPPLHFINLDSTSKAFRPNSLAVFCMLMCVYSAERQWKWATISWLLLAISGGEDYALQGIMLGLIWLVRGRRQRGEVIFGLALAMGSAVLLALLLAVVIPYFRNGQPPHYSPYFSALGNTPAEIVVNVLTNPRLVVDRLLNVRNLVFLIFLLTPVMFLPLGSLLRFSLTLPTFLFLMLGERDGMNSIHFHFHAPLVAGIFWATIARVAQFKTDASQRRWACRLIGAGITLAILYGETPISWRFHDPACIYPPKDIWGIKCFEPRGGTYWKQRFMPGPRAASLKRAMDAIKLSERVAATDYIRGAFIHHAAAHEFPSLKPHITIDDVDVIVIDKTEAWWGRGNVLPQGEHPLEQLRKGMTMHRQLQPPIPIDIYERPFQVIYHDEYILAVRRRR